MKDWIGVFEHCIAMLKTALSNVVLCSYFIVSVCIVGGAGVWLPWITANNPEYLRGDNIFTYVVAILGGLLCDRLIFAKSSSYKNTIDGAIIDQAIEPYEIRNKAIGVLLGSIALLFVSIGYVKYPSISSIYALLGLGLSLVIVLITVSTDKDKLPSDAEVKPNSPLGDSNGAEPNANFLRNSDD